MHVLDVICYFVTTVVDDAVLSLGFGSNVSLVTLAMRSRWQVRDRAMAGGPVEPSTYLCQ